MAECLHKGFVRPKKSPGLHTEAARSGFGAFIAVVRRSPKEFRHDSTTPSQSARMSPTRRMEPYCRSNSRLARALGSAGSTYGIRNGRVPAT